MRCRKEVAKPFQKWVCGEVLPSLRKKGEYKMNEEYMKKLEDANKKEIELMKQKELVDLELRRTKIELESAHKKTNKILSRRYNEYKLGHVVYLFKDDINDEKSPYRIGKSENISKRERDYCSTNKSGNIIYVQYCLNCNITEKLLHHMLDKYRIFPDQEWFHNFPSESFAIQAIQSVIYIMDSHINNMEQFMPHLYNQMIFPIGSVYEISSNDKTRESVEETSTKLIKVFNDTEPKAIIRKTNINKLKPMLKQSSISTEETGISDIKAVDTTEDALVNEEPSTSDILDSNTTESELTSYGRKNPTDFDAFVKECCEVDKTFHVPTSELKDAYRIWSKCSTGVEFYDTIRRNVFRGLKMKPLTFTPSLNTLDYEQFIIDRCEVHYTYRVAYVDFFRHFLEWKQETDPYFKLTTKYKNEIQKHLETIFSSGRVLTKAVTKDKKIPNVGIWGLGLEQTNFGLKILTRHNKKIGIFNAKTDQLIEEYDSKLFLCKSKKISYSQIGSYIRFKKIVDGKLYKFIE
jgi:hypothetical protein